MSPVMCNPLCEPAPSVGPMLLHLPVDILVHIVDSVLAVGDKLRLRRVCRTLRSIVDDERAWRSIGGAMVSVGRSGDIVEHTCQVDQNQLSLLAAPCSSGWTFTRQTLLENMSLLERAADALLPRLTSLTACTLCVKYDTTLAQFAADALIRCVQNAQCTHMSVFEQTSTCAIDTYSSGHSSRFHVRLGGVAANHIRQSIGVWAVD
jgi:hypothetical protein